MRDNLKIGILPIDIQYNDVEANLQQVVDGIETALKYNLDIIALPELFSSGFITDEKLLNRRAAEGPSVIERLSLLSSESGIALTGSCISIDGESPVNRGFIILPDGTNTFYDKRHLFCLSPEHELVKRGSILPPAVNFRGWRLSIIVCYDLRFPAWCRNTPDLYDILFVPANWPKIREYAWKHLLIARGIENQAYIVGANRSGEDNFGNYDDTSLIVDPMGQPVAEETEGLLIATCLREEIDRTRTKLPAHRDSDTFNIVGIGD